VTVTSFIAVYSRYRFTDGIVDGDVQVDHDWLQCWGGLVPNILDSIV
jgi:hypothetical protein